MNTKFTLLFICLLAAFQGFADDTLNVEEEQQLMLEYEQMINQFYDSLEQTLVYETDLVQLRNNIATVKVPKGFKYLNGEDSEMILTELWGNPPSEPGYESYGMLFPLESTLLSDSLYVINITFSEEGYIDDSDAKEIDYDELLEQMIEDTDLSNEYREENGYPSIKLIGWASAPYYDAVDKKIHWAKELNFGDDETNTLNYEIRILGRKGYLSLNAIGDMSVLDDVKKDINPILESVNFTPGNSYADFNSEIDKVAAIGVAGLIAGKVLAKAGILAKLGVFFAKFGKIIFFGLVAGFAGIRKFFTRQ